MEVTLAKMVCILLLVWILAWTPYAAMSCWVMFFNEDGFSPIMGLIPTICCKLSASTNAMLYGLRYSQTVVTIMKALEELLDVNQIMIIMHNSIMVYGILYYHRYNTMSIIFKYCIL